MELADALVINKADGESLHQAVKTQGHYQNAVHLFSHDATWTPPVLTCSALEGTGIADIWQTMTEYETQSIESGAKIKKRAHQNLAWMNALVHEMFESKLDNNIEVKQVKNKLEARVENGEVSPFAAAQEIMSKL